MMSRLIVSFLLCWSFTAVLAITVPPDEEIYPRVKAKLVAHEEYIDRKIKRIGNNTIELEIFIASEGDFKLASQIFSDYPKYYQWVLNNINQRPSGGNYYFLVRGIKVDPADKSVVIGDFFFNLPLFKKELLRSFRMTPTQKEQSFTLLAEAVKNEESVVGVAEAFLKVYPAEKKKNRIWIYLKGQVVLRNWLLYEALPEKLIARESGERLQIVMDNYIAEEDRLKTQTVRPKVRARASNSNRP